MAPVVLVLVLSPVAASVSASAGMPSVHLQSVKAVHSSFVTTVGVCSRRYGPYLLQSQAYRWMRFAQSKGYRTSQVYGIGGVISRYSNRRYYFNVYYSC